MSKKEPDSYKRMTDVFASIAKDGTIPDDIKLILATSALREGFGIESPVDYMYVDSHIESDVIQMSGRVRKGGHELIVVVDSPEYYTSASFELEQSTQKLETEALTAINQEFSTIEDEDKQLRFIEYIEQSDKKIKNQMHPYVRFNYYTGLFEYYYLREVFINYAKEQYEIWHNFKEYGYNNFSDIVQGWFGNDVNVSQYETKKQLSYKYLWKIAKIRLSNETKTTQYTKEKVEKIVAGLQMIWGDKYKTINSLLGLFSDYKCERCGASNKYRKFIKCEKENSSIAKNSNKLLEADNIEG